MSIQMQVQRSQTKNILALDARELEAMASKLWKSDRMQKQWLAQTLRLISERKHALITGGWCPKGN